MKIYFKNIHSAMVAAFLILIIPLIFILLSISIFFTKSSVQDNSTHYTLQLIHQVNNKVDSYIDFMENISDMILNTNASIKYLSEEFESEGEKERVKQQLVNEFSTILEVRDDVYSIALYGENGRILLNDDTEAINPNVNIKSKSWYKRALEAKGKIILTSAHVQNVIDHKYRWVVNLSRAVIDPVTNEPIGVFWVDLNFKVLSDLCESINLGNKGYVFVLDENGDIVYHPKQQLLYTGLKSEHILEVMSSKQDSFVIYNKDKSQEKLYTISRSNKTGWSVIGVAYTKELVKNEDKVRLMYFISACILFLCAVLISYLLSKQISRPIKLLKESMKEVEKGNFEPASDIVISDSEIGKLGKAFSIMTERIGTLMDEKLKAEEAKRHMEIRALQAQINPHFLYNTLDSIVWMAESGKNQEVIIMTVSLARLLRQSISNNCNAVTIGQEINYVKSYLTIQKQRYRDQLNFKINVPLEIQQYKIIKLTLQPLVENAIYHGIKYKEGKGTIFINGYEKEDSIVIEIIDDGIGMDEETLKNILITKPDDTKSNGVGVYNVNERIKLHYGKQYGLKYESKLNEGTKIVMVLPKDYE